MAITSFTPNIDNPRLSGLNLPLRTATLATLTTSGGVRTVTAAELLGGLLIFNTDDAQTATLPTATLLNAALPAPAVGMSFQFDVINTGDSVLTIAVGTGGTLATGSNSKSTVATLATLVSKRFILVVTGVAAYADPTSSNTYILYGFGSTAAAVA